MLQNKDTVTLPQTRRKVAEIAAVKAKNKKYETLCVRQICCPTEWGGGGGKEVKVNELCEQSIIFPCIIKKQKYTKSATWNII